MHGKPGTLRDLFGDRRGAISIIAAFALVGLIGISALALEYGHALLQKTEDQRAADLAAYAGALVYGATTSQSDAKAAAANVAALNGFSSTEAKPSFGLSPTGDSNSDVKVTVTSAVPLLLARVLTTSPSLPVSATASAEIKTDAPGCIIALGGGGTGVTMSGGTNITADNCAVASDNSLSLSGGAALITQTVDYAKAAPSVSVGAAIAAPSGETLNTNHVATIDPLSPSSGSTGSSEVTKATGRLSTVASITSPTEPSPPRRSPAEAR
jgi:Flp pilus assembly protein TadG